MRPYRKLHVRTNELSKSQNRPTVAASAQFAEDLALLGPWRARTAGLLLAKQALSQLS